MTSSASASATTRIPIFRPGRHTAANGVSLTVTADELKAVAALYDPDTHEASIVVGHPATNAPAWGWVRALEYADGELVAIGHQLDPTFRDWVDAGRFKKRSASWYLPDAPGNPRPGSLYLRHVGFLGAQPPAVKGLSEVQFHASDQGVVEFSASQSWSRTVNELFQSLRDGLLARFGLDETDRILPAWHMRQLTDMATAMAQETGTQVVPSQVTQFHETPMNPSTNPTPAAAPVPAPTAPPPIPAPAVPGTADLAERERTLTEREMRLAERERATLVAELARTLQEDPVREGRMPPVHVPAMVQFMAGGRPSRSGPPPPQNDSRSWKMSRQRSSEMGSPAR